MHMEASMLIKTMAHFPEWNCRLLEDSDEEASQMQVKLLQDEGRNGVWKMCQWFGCEEHGVPGQACRLLERYLFNVLHNCDTDINQRELRESLPSQIPVLMASCITLAAKMNNASTPIFAKVVHIVLMCKKIPCTVDEIIANEFKVFKTLDFRMPLWTNVEIGEMLAVEVGCPTKMLEDVAIVIDMAEFKRHVINQKVQWAAKVSPTSHVKVLSLHLTAGAVAATSVVASFSGRDTVARLARLTNAPLTYIQCIQDVIIALIVSDIRVPGSTLKANKRK